MTRDQRYGALFILLSAVGYALFPIFSRQVLDAGMQPPDIALIRFALAVPLLWLLATLRRSDSLGAPARWLKVLALGPVITAAALLAFFGFQMIPAGVFVLLFYSYPALIALLSLLRGERLSALAWLALGLTLLGVVLTIPQDQLRFDGENNNTLIGVILAMLNSVVIVIFFVLSSRWLQGYRDTTRATALTLTGTLIPLIVWNLIDGVVLPSDPSVWLALIGMAIFSTVLPFAMVQAGLKRLGAARSSILSTAEPLLLLLFEFLIYGATVTGVQLTGGILIVAAVILLQLNPPTTRRAVQPETAAS